MTLKTPNKATESTVEVDALYKFYHFKIYILVNPQLCFEPNQLR